MFSLSSWLNKESYLLDFHIFLTVYLIIIKLVFLPEKDEKEYHVFRAVEQLDILSVS